MRKSASLLSPNLRWFLLAMIIANVAGSVAFSLLPLYLADLGASVVQIGSMFTLASLVPLLLQILGGWLSDSIGRLRTIAIGAVVSTFGYLGMVLAPSWPWAAGTLCVVYVSGALVGPSFAAYVAEQASEAQRGRVFGLSGGLFMIVGVLGPPMAGFLAERYGFRGMLWVAFLLYACASALRVWMAMGIRFEPRFPADKLTLDSLRAGLADMFAMLAAGGLITWIWVTDGVRDVSFRLSDELYPLYLSDVAKLTVSQIGWVRSLSAAVRMLTLVPAGWASDRLGERVTIVAGMTLHFASYLVFLLSRGLGGFGVTSVVSGLGVGLMTPAYDALVSKAVPEERRGIAFGLLHTSLGLISLPTPWLGAQLWERFDPKLPFAVTGALLLLAIVPVWKRFVLPGGQPTRAS